MDSNEKKLPSKWEKANLEDLISKSGIFSDGDWVESKDQDPQGATRLLQLADIGDASFINKSSRHVNDEQFNKLNCTEVLEGDILIARMPDPLGRCCITPKLNQRLITVVDVAIVRPGENSVDAKWLMHTINSPQIRELISIQATGTTRKRITRKKLAKLLLSIPPLNEQRRIADKLDTTLAAIEACKQKLNNAAETIQRFRQSVLAAAVSGELTREWREERGIDEEWEDKQLQALLDEPMRNGKSVRDGSETKVLRLSCLSHDLVNTSDNKSGDWTGINPKPFLIKEGDFLIARGNGSINLVGRGRLVLETKEEIAFPDTMIRIRPDKNKIRSDYLALLWESSPIRKQLELGARTSAGIWKISQGDLNCIKIKIPTLAEQDQICLKALEHLSTAQNLKDKIQDSFKILELLSKALLAKAFRGELVPQD